MESKFVQNQTLKVMQKRLIRSKTQRMIGGVCGGIAEYFNIDPTIIRLGFVLASIFLALVGGIIAYVLALFIIPEE